MSIKIMSWVWDNSPYEGKALLIHLALADFANDSGECWPSQNTLAKKSRCSVRHVRDVVHEMEKDGLVEIVSVSTGYDSHRYKLIARNSVPPRNSTTPTPEVGDHTSGNPTPKNRQEPSGTITCPYCKNTINPKGRHKCSAMNQIIK